MEKTGGGVFSAVRALWASGSDAWADYARVRNESSTRLKAASLVAFTVERFFYALHWLSPASRLGGRATDLYILVWFVVLSGLGLASYCFYPNLPGGLSCGIVVAAGLRILDLTQIVVNLGLFGHLGSPPEKQQEVVNVTRSLVLLLWNFLELILWFGLLYLPLTFAQPKSFWSMFYFSGITQLTIGYGDFTPVGLAKAIAILQGSLGWLVTVIVVARFVAALPGIREQTRS